MLARVGRRAPRRLRIAVSRRRRAPSTSGNRFVPLVVAITRVVVGAAGIGVFVLSLVTFPAAYSQAEKFHAALNCGAGLDCFEPREVRVVDRNSRTEGVADDEYTVHSISWREPDGSPRLREVREEVYDNARAGAPATLRMWNGHIVAVTIGDATDWSLPEPVSRLVGVLATALLGIGLVAVAVLSPMRGPWLLLVPGVVLGTLPVALLLSQFMDAWAFAPGPLVAFGVLVGVVAAKYGVGELRYRWRRRSDRPRLQ